MAVEGIPEVRGPALALSMALLVLLAVYTVSFVQGSSHPILLAGTEVVLSRDLPPLDRSFWVTASDTSLVGSWVSDGPMILAVVIYGEPIVMLLPHRLVDHCGGTLNVPLEPGHYLLTAFLGSENVTRLTIVQTFELAPSPTIASGPGTLIACPGAVG